MLERALRTRAQRRDHAAAMLHVQHRDQERKAWATAITVGDLVRPYLKGVMYFTQPGTGAARLPAETVYNELKSKLEQAIERMRKVRASATDLEDIKYALVAFTDERMLQDSPYADFWQSHRLQMEYFGETRGGEGFFERLRGIKSHPSRHGALRVYYICLLLGFHGMYRNMDGLGRENLIEELRLALHSVLPEPATTTGLSPHGSRPHEPAADRERNQLMRWLALTASAVGIAFYLGMRVTLDAREHTLDQRVRQALLDLGVDNPE